MTSTSVLLNHHNKILANHPETDGNAVEVDFISPWNILEDAGEEYSPSILIPNGKDIVIDMTGSWLPRGADTVEERNDILVQCVVDFMANGKVIYPEPFTALPGSGRPPRIRVDSDYLTIPEGQIMRINLISDDIRYSPDFE